MDLIKQDGQLFYATDYLGSVRAVSITSNCVVDLLSFIPYFGIAESLAWNFYGEYYFNQNIMPYISYYYKHESE